MCRLILVLMHLLSVATAYAAQQTLGIAQPVSRPYLASMGAPALRFQDAPPAPPPMVKPIASGPPVAASAPAEAEVNLANDQAAASTPPMPLPSEPKPSPASEPEKPEPPAASPPKVLPILPDDTRRKVQSQDFLPLFRLPGPGGATEDVTIIVPGVPTPPVPGTLPPSSATYRQN
jgi:hypothetical protein